MRLKKKKKRSFVIEGLLNQIYTKEILDIHLFLIWYMYILLHCIINYFASVVVVASYASNQ